MRVFKTVTISKLLFKKKKLKKTLNCFCEKYKKKTNVNIVYLRFEPRNIIKAYIPNKKIKH